LLGYLERYGLVKTELRKTGREKPVVDRFAEPTEKLYGMENFLLSLD